jgi:hypothetical protein
MGVVKLMKGKGETLCAEVDNSDDFGFVFGFGVSAKITSGHATAGIQQKDVFEVG